MLKLVAPMLAYLTLITAGIVLFADASRPIFPCECVESQQSHAENGEKVAEPTEQSGWSGWMGRPIEFFTFWIMALTVVLTASTTLMWIETRKAADAAAKAADIAGSAAESSMRMERAYLFVQTLECNVTAWSPEDRNTSTFQFLLTNYGRTPARFGQYVFQECKFRADGEVLLGRPRDAYLMDPAVAVPQSNGVRLPKIVAELPVAQFQQGDRATFYVFGEIPFQDVFDEWRCLWFLAAYHIESGRYRMMDQREIPYEKRPEEE